MQGCKGRGSPVAQGSAARRSTTRPCIHVLFLGVIDLNEAVKLVPGLKSREIRGPGFTWEATRLLFTACSYVGGNR